jgi:hypothetical protein
MERKMMLILPKRVAASSMCKKGLWRIFLAQSTGATFSDNGANFLSSWCQIEVNCYSTSSYERNILEKMREEARRKKEDLLLPASEQMYLLMGSEAWFSLFQARRGDDSFSQEVETSGRSGAYKGCGQLW